MSSLAGIRDRPGRYLAWFHDDSRFFRKESRPEKPPVFRLFQVESTNGGLTWGQPRVLFASADVHLCEPGWVRSPDGTEIALLLRENRRAKRSHVMFSRDEGRTWTPPRELPASLCGDRHVTRYGPDGRLFVSFRDTAKESPSAGDWIGWIGRYEDLKSPTEAAGTFRVRLGDNHHAWDCAYPGVEVLPNGTFVVTTYGHWEMGQPPFVVCRRFSLRGLDDLLSARTRTGSK
ncbi:MAG: exo-alpha-sialidase [Verrucomicrobia bacterium]|nr:exo-alpha-sialidase [Verrucomicrobiota bacterium]